MNKFEIVLMFSPDLATNVLDSEINNFKSKFILFNPLILQFKSIWESTEERPEVDPEVTALTCNFC